jgi:hypothetical protein
LFELSNFAFIFSSVVVVVVLDVPRLLAIGR